MSIGCQRRLEKDIPCRATILISDLRIRNVTRDREGHNEKEINSFRERNNLKCVLTQLAMELINICYKK